jgi:tRNA(Arg) A34 adenosine deaminase TadA
MDGNKVSQNIIDVLFDWARQTMEERKSYPYVSFVVKDNIIVSKGINRERETYDLTNQDQVVSVREAQNSLDTGNLKGYSLVSLFEPTLLAFDVALWAGITDFHWCINASSSPVSYNPMSYSIKVYKNHNPDKITIESGIREKEALGLLKIAEKNKYLP